MEEKLSGRSLQLQILHANSERNIETAFASFAQQHINAILVAGDSFFLSRRDQLIAAAASHAIPTGGKSTGPRTPEGLERSRRANWKHGHFSREAKAGRRGYRHLA